MSAPLVHALRTVADRLAGGAPFQWGHMGQCNCGHLAQIISGRTAGEIHRSALSRATGEWTEFANDYCTSSGALIDDVMESLLDVGMSRDDLAHLENLSDPAVLAQLGRAQLTRCDRDDAIAYFRAFADVVAQRSVVVATRQPR